MRDTIRCANPNCRRHFSPNPRVKDQHYCCRKECQRVRKRLWQSQKMASDSDYQANQRDCQKRWRKEHPDYWRQYRSQNPHYVQSNRIKQRERDRKRRLGNLAKMDALDRASLFKSRTYYLFPAGIDLAKMDALKHRYILIPTTYNYVGKSCKERTR
jgi:hypothetical protein